MNDQFNPYVEWLGLGDAASRPNHYALLGLELYESDPQKIKQGADRAVTRVRGFRPGDKARYWATLLDEIDAARKCLGDDARRREYDAELRRQGSAAANAAASTGFVAGVAPSGNPAMYPPGMVGSGPERYGPAGPAPDDAPQQLARANAGNVASSRFAPGYDATSAPTSTAPSPTASPIASPRKLPMSRDALAASADPMASVYGGPSGVDPMAPVADPLGATAGGYIPSSAQPPFNPAAGSLAQPYGQSAYGQAAYGASLQPMTAVPLGVAAAANPMAPVAMPVGAGYDAAAYSAGGYQPAFAQSSPGWGGTASATTPMSAVPTPIVAARAKPSGQGARLLLVGVICAVAMGLGGLLVFVAMSGDDDSPDGTSVATVDPDDTPLPADSGTNEEDNDETDVVPPPDPEPEPEPEPMPPEPTPEPEPAPEPAPQPEPDPEPAAEPEPAPQPTPEPEPTAPPVPMLTAQERAALQQALIDARQAMADRDLETARAKLAEAEQIAKREEHLALVERTKELENYVSQFWEAVDQGYAGLQPTGTLKIGDAEAAVVEVREDALVIKWFGRNQTIQRDGMPAGLAMAIANSWFDNNPQNNVIRGAFMLVDPKGRPEEAKRLWTEAANSGVAVESLMKVLKDNYEL